MLSHEYNDTPSDPAEKRLLSSGKVIIHVPPKEYGSYDRGHLCTSLLGQGGLEIAQARKANRLYRFEGSRALVPNGYDAATATRRINVPHWVLTSLGAWVKSSIAVGDIYLKERRFFTAAKSVKLVPGTEYKVYKRYGWVTQTYPAYPMDDTVRRYAYLNRMGLVKPVEGSIPSYYRVWDFARRREYDLNHMYTRKDGPVAGSKMMVPLASLIENSGPEPSEFNELATTGTIYRDARKAPKVPSYYRLIGAMCLDEDYIRDGEKFWVLKDNAYVWDYPTQGCHYLTSQAGFEPAKQVPDLVKGKEYEVYSGGTWGRVVYHHVDPFDEDLFMFYMRFGRLRDIGVSDSTRTYEAKPEGWVIVDEPQPHVPVPPGYGKAFQVEQASLDGPRYIRLKAGENAWRGDDCVAEWYAEPRSLRCSHREKQGGICQNSFCGMDVYQSWRFVAMRAKGGEAFVEKPVEKVEEPDSGYLDNQDLDWFEGG